jgi:hypothetical protein
MYFSEEIKRINFCKTELSDVNLKKTLCSLPPENDP